MSGAAPLGGRRALVTGGARGLGRATAVALAGAGARVALVDRLADELAEVAAACNGEAIAADLGDRAAARAAVRRARAALGGLDLVVAAAGLTREGAADELSDAAFAEVVGVTLGATYAVVHEALDDLTRAGGDIVVVGSTLGHRGLPRMAAYSAAKHGAVALAGVLDAELWPHGVRVLCVSPGSMRTHFFDVFGGAGDWPMLAPERVAGVIVDACSRPASERLAAVVLLPTGEPHWP